MSRSFRCLFFPLLLLSLGVTGCRTSTPYTRMYSPRTSYFVAPQEKSGKSADELIKATDAPAPGVGLPQPPALPPAPAIPGLDPGLPVTPPPAPAADPLPPPAPAPAADPL